MCVYCDISIVSGALVSRGISDYRQREKSVRFAIEDTRQYVSGIKTERTVRLSRSGRLETPDCSLSSGDVAVDVVFLLGGVFDSEGCEFVAVMVLDASALLTIEAVVALGRRHDTGRRHSQWISRGAFTGRLFRPFATVPYCGVGRVSMINVESTQVLIKTLINSKMAYGKLTNDVVDEEREGNYVERNLPQLSVECQTPPARGRPCYRGGKASNYLPPEHLGAVEWQVST